ncbi:MAG: NAD-dependent epimerase/dehydratase family protein, partial [Methylophagaceae bacterium]
MKTILVTGGFGFIGSRLVEELSKTCKVIVLDNKDTYGTIDQ